MPHKGHTAEQIISILRQMAVEQSKVKAVEEVCRETQVKRTKDQANIIHYSTLSIGTPKLLPQWWLTLCFKAVGGNNSHEDQWWPHKKIETLNHSMLNLIQLINLQLTKECGHTYA